MMLELSWQEVVQRLDLMPHPEGGYFRETFRDIEVDQAGRARSTAIYFSVSATDNSSITRRVESSFLGPAEDFL